MRAAARSCAWIRLLDVVVAVDFVETDQQLFAGLQLGAEYDAADIGGRDFQPIPKPSFRT
jgi:hypothetical protein